MLHVIKVQPQTAFALWLRFNDGSEGVVDLASELDGPIFAPLLDPVLFSQVMIDAEIGTIAWPNGADFAPEFLHSRLQSTAGRQ